MNHLLAKLMPSWKRCHWSLLSCHYSLFKCNWRSKSILGKGRDTRREMVPNFLAFVGVRISFWPRFGLVACPRGLVINCAY